MTSKQKQLSVWMRKSYGNLGSFILAGFTLSVMFSSLRNWANHEWYQLLPSTHAELCWSSNAVVPKLGV